MQRKIGRGEHAAQRRLAACVLRRSFFIQLEELARRVARGVARSGLPRIDRRVIGPPWDCPAGTRPPATLPSRPIFLILRDAASDVLEKWNKENEGVRGNAFAIASLIRVLARMPFFLSLPLDNQYEERILPLIVRGSVDGEQAR